MTAPVPSLAYPQPIDHIIAAAVHADFDLKIAFEWSLLLLCHGTPVHEAVAAFRQCERWVQ